ncbi:MAG: hypothetical protein AABY16_02300 [Nanoarchaeota archaeon]
MAIKTFNLDEQVYKEFSKHCRKNGISMSKRVENFIRDEIVRIKDRVLAKKPVLEKIETNFEQHSFSKYC